MSDLTGYVTPDRKQEEKKGHINECISMEQLTKMKGLYWAIGLVATLLVFGGMSIVAWIGCLLSYNDWRYADAGVNKELFKRDFLDPRKDLIQHTNYRYDLVWYAFARETLEINIVTTAFSFVVGYAWLVYFGRRDTKSALNIGYTAAVAGTVVAALCCFMTKTTLALAAIEVAYVVYLFYRKKAVLQPLLGDEESARNVESALDPVQKNPTLLVITFVSMAVEGAVQLSVFACWSFWVSDWRMWFTWILSIWLMDALRMVTLGSMIKSVEAAQKEANGTLSTSAALMVATKSFLQSLVNNSGSIANLAFLWMPLRMVGEICSLVGDKLKGWLTVAETIAHWKSPFATVYIALRDCDGPSAMDSSMKLMTNSGVPLSSSPASVYTSPSASEYQLLVTNAFRLIGFSLSYVASASCGIPFNVAFWICFMCSGISASLATPLCTLLDGMLCYTYVNSN